MHSKKFVLLLFVLVFCQEIISQVKFCSWNLENFGRSKTDSTIHFIANTLKAFDVVAVVEVVAGNGGTQAVAKLADALNRKGSAWSYCISDPTSGTANSSERYAFLWKPGKLKLKGKAWLETRYKKEIEREPYFATFSAGDKEFTLCAFHAIPKEKDPAKEIKYFKLLPAEYPGKTLLFSGDFNCPESHTVFIPLKNLAYKPVVTNQKTSLKKECDAKGCLASEYDNIFFNTKKITCKKAGVIHFYRSFNTLKKARTVSDHLPVYCEFLVN